MPAGEFVQGGDRGSGGVDCVVKLDGERAGGGADVWLFLRAMTFRALLIDCCPYSDGAGSISRCVLPVFPCVLGNVVILCSKNGGCLTPRLPCSLLGI